MWKHRIKKVQAVVPPLPENAWRCIALFSHNPFPLLCASSATHACLLEYGELWHIRYSAHNWMTYVDQRKRACRALRAKALKWKRRDGSVDARRIVDALGIGEFKLNGFKLSIPSMNASVIWFSVNFVKQKLDKDEPLHLSMVRRTVNPAANVVIRKWALGSLSSHQSDGGVVTVLYANGMMKTYWKCDHTVANLTIAVPLYDLIKDLLEPVPHPVPVAVGDKLIVDITLFGVAEKCLAQVLTLRVDYFHQRGWVELISPEHASVHAMNLDLLKCAISQPGWNVSIPVVYCDVIIHNESMAVLQQEGQFCSIDSPSGESADFGTSRIGQVSLVTERIALELDISEIHGRDGSCDRIRLHYSS